MIELTIEAYPLHWPQGWKKTARPINSRFDTKLIYARGGLLDEIHRLGGRMIVLSTNIPLRKDGLPYANYKTPDDKGVAVYFQLHGISQVFACDKWNSVEDNMQAIRKTIEAIRGIDRWGSSEMMNRAYAGFQALPETAGVSTMQLWWEVLNVDPSMELADIERAYRSLAKEVHPDVGGKPELFVRLSTAIEQARKEKR